MVLLLLRIRCATWEASAFLDLGTVATKENRTLRLRLVALVDLAVVCLETTKGLLESFSQLRRGHLVWKSRRRAPASLAPPQF